ncbi:hypothetical protein ACFL5O_06635, partial [Myxococcota bacterium]
QPGSQNQRHEAAALGDPRHANELADNRDWAPGPPTLLVGRRAKFGGYGGLTIRYTRVAGDNGLLVGAEGALLIDHRFALGGAGYGLVTPRLYSNDQPRVRLGMGYGGGVLRYHFVLDSPLYVSAGVLVGAGVLGEARDDDDDDEIAVRSSSRRIRADGCFVAEPSLGVHLNVTRWMRVGLEGAYRFASGVDTAGFDDSDLGGLSLGGNVQFGWL